MYGEVKIQTERERQLTKGYTPSHDLGHADKLLSAARVYAGVWPGIDWPFDPETYHPRGPVENIVRAGAMFLAVIQAIDPLDSIYDEARAGLAWATDTLNGIYADCLTTGSTHNVTKIVLHRESTPCFCKASTDHREGMEKR